MSIGARKNLFTVLLLVIIVVMGFEIVYLVYQNRRLQALLAETSSLQVLQEGQKVPPLAATDLTGNPISLRYGEQEPSTLLIWFSPSCHVCKENSAFWNDIYAKFNMPGLRIVAMCDAGVEEAKAYAAEQAYVFPVVSVTDDRLIEAYNGRVMPQTALISPQGGIRKVWPGALEKSRQDEIIAALNALKR